MAIAASICYVGSWEAVDRVGAQGLSVKIVHGLGVGMKRRRTVGKSATAIAALVGVAVLFGGGSDRACAGTDEFITGTLALELNDINRVQSNYLANRNVFSFFAEADLSAHLSDTVLLRAVGTYDPVTDPRPNSNRFLQDQGFHAKDIYVQYDDGTTGGQLGRITANFGTAWYLAPGLKATLLAEDYAIWDKFGASGWVRHRFGDFGEIKIGAAAFFLDTTALSGSLLGGRHRKAAWMGGPSNTGIPNSFNLSLDGSNIPSLPGFSWHSALLDQAVDFRLDGNGNQIPGRDERGVVVGIKQGLDLTDTVRSTTLMEVVRFEDKGGTPGQARTYLTVGDTLNSGPWRLEGTATLRATERPRSGTIVDDLITASIGYDLSQAAVDLGWQQAMFGTQVEDVIRLRLRYMLGLSTR